MSCIILAGGEPNPAWLQTAFNGYTRRLMPPYNVTLKLINHKQQQHAAPAFQAAIPKQSLTIVLDEHGQQLPTMELAHKITVWQQQAPNLVWIIGGADGLPDSIKQAADYCLALSQLTLPHLFTRLLLVEQIYRAASILRGHPYHRI